MPRNQIPAPKKPLNTPIVPSKEYFDELRMVFDFHYFKTENVRVGDFHSYCENRKAALEQIADIFYTFNTISQHTCGELGQDERLRSQLHWNKIYKEKPLSRINGVLRDGYHFPKGTIEQFENEYIEFSCSNGQRIFCIVRDNVIAPLFLDPNHLICQEGASQDVERKQGWKYPSLLNQDFAERIVSEDDEARKMILDGVKSGDYKDMDELRKIIEDFGL